MSNGDWKNPVEKGLAKDLADGYLGLQAEITDIVEALGMLSDQPTHSEVLAEIKRLRGVIVKNEMIFTAVGYSVPRGAFSRLRTRSYKLFCMSDTGWVQLNKIDHQKASDFHRGWKYKISFD